MRLLETEIHINARPETVWSILTDFATYPQWNPFITHIRGNAAAGETLEIHVSPPRGKATAFKSVVLAATENKEFRWIGRFLVSALFEGEHSFILTPHEGGCRLVQKEQFKGMLVPLMWRSLNRDTRAGFELMNQSLKEWAERQEL